MHSLHPAVSALMRRAAAEIILPRFGQLKADQRHEKTPGDFVTIADHESEDLLTAGLLALLPDSRVLGEEAEAHDPGSIGEPGEGAVWTVDPLDGTNNFAAGHGPFAVMIGLAVNGVTEAGWILDPQSGRMCHAARGQGAFIDDTRVVAKTTGEPLPVAAISLKFIGPERRTDIRARADGRLHLTRIPFCAGEQYPRLVLGTNDVALFERTCPWDHVPGALFVSEAGGKVARPDGSDYRIDVPGTGLLGAASPELWGRAVGILFGA
ncbi:MAG: inositol monophosphatase family protein [Sphingomonadaceae bacterium]